MFSDILRIDFPNILGVSQYKKVGVKTTHDSVNSFVICYAGHMHRCM